MLVKLLIPLLKRKTLVFKLHWYLLAIEYKNFVILATQSIGLKIQKMKTCVVLGDLSSDLSSENYPTVPVCDDCFAECSDSESIISSDDFDPVFGNSCHYCGKSKEEEENEQC